MFMCCRRAAPSACRIRAAADLEEGVAVEHTAEDLSHLVGAGGVARDDRQQLVVGALGVVARLRSGDGMLRYQRRFHGSR